MSSAELPELEILRRDLDKEVSGKKIKAVDVPGKKSIARAGTPKALATRLTGVKIERVTRKGTWISLALDSGDVMLVALGAKSRLRRAQNKDALDPGTAVVLTFTQHGQLRLIDPASTAELFLVPSDEVAATIGSLGLDLRCVPEVAHPQRFQVVRRRHHPATRAGGHRRRRSQRVGQVERGRRHRWVLGAQAPSAVRSPEDGRRHLRRHRQATGAGSCRGDPHHRQLRGLLPIEFTEVTISRTLFRTGDSEYAINGVNCRLLDVQELLSDAGVGRQQHVIVSQGQIDAVLNARPEDRRSIIEEAAGVLKYRRRKEKSERRLDATEASLLRVQDLLREVRRQLRPLERQADAARRHGDLVAELTALAGASWPAARSPGCARACRRRRRRS
jgi:hypothetical protein